MNKMESEHQDGDRKWIKKGLNEGFKGSQKEKGEKKDSVIKATKRNIKIKQRAKTKVTKTDQME